ncbi:MAG: AzlC family ABC transporter permease [Candidatus Bipolaricaulota bacterium]|nr:AzlC family ABC transporter permease [Candidatus Bipolaricaulota bacterium]MBS3791613.1 AzlC family ABC transporter permease [Candidatus Bipolaricaulota bacterium]
MANYQLNLDDSLRGIRSAIGLGIGYVPIGVTYGLLARTGGLNFLETLAMSLMVFAGASQFIALNLISTGVGPVQIVFTVFMVNLRHFLMSTSLREKIDGGNKMLEMIYSFGITDETFAVASVEDGEVNPPYMFGLNLVAYVSWAASSGAGYLLGGGLPTVLQESLSIALYALFIGLLVPSVKRNSGVLVIASLAGGLNSGLRLVLSPGWSIVIGSLIAAVAGTLIFGTKVDTTGNGSDLNEDR